VGEGAGYGRFAVNTTGILRRKYVNLKNLCQKNGNGKGTGRNSKTFTRNERRGGVHRNNDGRELFCEGDVAKKVGGTQ